MSALRPQLRCESRPRSGLDAATKDAMFQLLCRHFDAVERSVFEADLAEKDRVLLLPDESGALRGFSTLRVWEDSTRGLTVIFSGDTIVDQAAWGSPALARGWLEAAMAVLDQASGPVWWLLICSGYRTYRFLPLFFREFWPRFDAETPESARALMDGLASGRYGDLYNNGVVRMAQGARVRPEVGGLTEARLSNPHVAFFAAANPGHVHGDELVCLTRVDPANFTAAALRVLAAVGR